ncbi:MAG: dihydrolipoyl dehydrogenase [Clostridiales bacterium]|nr:dihydrolipoyl dehydrogenase [Clostridiales bacterium]
MEIVVMPKLGFNMDEGKLTVWYKKEGDSIKKGEPLFAIETDKTAIDVEGTQDGVVRRQFIAEGDTIPVTLPIAIVAGSDEDIAEAEADATAQLEGAVSATAAEAAAVAPVAAAPVPVPVAAPVVASGVASVPQGWSGGIGVGDPAYDFDVFVIGGGPGGYVAAIKAGQLGLRTAVAEKDSFGGVCLNRGCIPTKTLLRSAEMLKDVKDAAEFGVVGLDAKKAALDMKKVQKRKKEIVDYLVGGVEVLFGKNNVTAIKGDAKIIDKNTVKVGKKTYKTANLIIATGSDITQLSADIAKTKTYMDSDDILNLDKLPTEVVVLGGGIIAVEFAYFLAAAGVKVDIVVRSKVLRQVDDEIAFLVNTDLQAMGIVFHEAAKVTKVTKDSVEYEKDGKKTVLKTKGVLLATGRAPVVADDALALGIDTENGAIVTDEYLRTNIEGVYAIGDVNGKTMLAHKASMEGIVAAENIAGHAVKMDYSAIPSVIYLKPEVAYVGLTEAEAKAKYDDVAVGRFPMAANGKSAVEGSNGGLIKVVVSKKYGEVLGAQLYCLHASDMIAEVGAAMRGEMTAEDMGRTVHPHPTVNEALMEAFEGALGKAIHC